MLVGKYSEGGSHGAVRRKLKKLRNERLAHRQTVATAIAEADPTAGEIESFYQDMSGLCPDLILLRAGDMAKSAFLIPWIKSA
jgi:hypothetical protein